MPASALGWPSPPTRGPILQAYGTKRKAAGGDEMVDWQQESQVCAKRICTVGIGTDGQSLEQSMQHEALQQTRQQQQQQQQPLSVFNNNNNTSINCNNNNVHMPSQNFLESGVDMATEEEEVIQPCVEVGAQLPWHTFQTTAIVHNQPADMVMDMNGETYSNTGPCAGVDAACASMDSDCTPNPQQCETGNRPVKSDAESQFCQAFCGAGDESPTSGRVRCFCKPSWEGMMELRPWISDVY